jgi:hypothetical protein
MSTDKNGRSAAAQATLNVLRAAGSVVGALGRRHVTDQVVQQATQLAVWEDEGGPVVEPPPVPATSVKT